MGGGSEKAQKVSRIIWMSPNNNSKNNKNQFRIILSNLYQKDQRKTTDKKENSKSDKNCQIFVFLFPFLKRWKDYFW